MRFYGIEISDHVYPTYEPHVMEDGIRSPTEKRFKCSSVTVTQLDSIDELHIGGNMRL